MTTHVPVSLDDTLLAIAGLGPLDEAAMADARDHLDRLTKPPGSLGRLEELAIDLAGITGQPFPTMARRAIVVAAADHGVARRGVSAYPSDVTAQMLANFVAGGAAINVLAEAAGASLTVVDVGVEGPMAAVLPEDERGARLVRARIRPGTADITEGPAMTRVEAVRSIDLGLDIVARLRASGVELIGIGDMGIGNTTAASAIVAVLTGATAASVTGRGTGIDAATYRRKIAAIERAIARNAPDPADPAGVLAAVGGLEIGALVGVILGAVAGRVPVVLDGFITGAAALLAAGMAPTAGRVIAAHRSVEPGHAIVLERLGLRPLLDLDLRLGEGTGAALAIGLIDAAMRLRDGMATFASAAVSGPLDGATEPGALS
jgi:nicotinate-nucleotide--dimethylbenzimidazole phosphoribosyltransferase